MRQRTREQISSERTYIAGRFLGYGAVVAYMFSRLALEGGSAGDGLCVAVLTSPLAANFIQHEFRERFRAARVRDESEIDGRLDDTSGDSFAVGYGLVSLALSLAALYAGVVSSGPTRLSSCLVAALGSCVAAVLCARLRRRGFLDVDRNCLIVAGRREVLTIPWRSVETLRGGRVGGSQKVLVGLASVESVDVKPAGRRPAVLRALRRNQERFESCLALDPDCYGLDRQATLDAFIAFARATDRYAASRISGPRGG